MDFSEKNIIQQFTGSALIDEVLINQLQEITTEYPYFGAAQFLLAKRMKSENHAGFEKQAQKAVLHFSNPHWLHYLLIEDKIKKHTNSESIDPQHEEIKASILEDEFKNQAESNNLPTIDEDIEILPIITTNTDALDFAALKNKDEKDFETEVDEVLEVEKINTNEQITSDIFEPFNNKLSDILKEQAAEFKKPLEANLPKKLAAEPYYTIDYFSSQGIKLEEIKQAHDQFDAKVKSFTDWLKQMKRVNPQPTDLGTDIETEKIIENIASSSNETREIVTEAMAQVLVKQGKIDKAIQLYIKLSFLNTDKSTYFAGKIEALKGI